MIVVSGTFALDPSKREQALKVAETMSTASLAESGCVTYGFWSDPRDPGAFRVFEEWESAEALDAHFATPHMATFLTEFPALGVSETDISRYVVSAKSKLM